MGARVAAGAHAQTLWSWRPKGRGVGGTPAHPFAAPTLNSHSLAADATVSKQEEG